MRLVLRKQDAIGKVKKEMPVFHMKIENIGVSLGVT